MSKSEPPDDSEVLHYARVLRQAIRVAGLSVSEVERRLGQGAKSLRRVFAGAVELKFKHVVSVLRIIGMSQEEFFALAAQGRRRRGPRSRGSEFLAAFERMGYRGEMVSGDDEDDPVSEEELNQMVAEAVKQVLVTRARVSGPAADSMGRVRKGRAKRPVARKRPSRGEAAAAGAPDPVDG
jgi:hypothetical protein